jgi:beta-glucosidase
LRPGIQTVQVYLSRPDSALERPQRRLAGFARAAAEPGQAVSVEIPLPRTAFAHWSVETHDWAVEAGTFDVYVGAHVLDTPLSGQLSVQ